MRYDFAAQTFFSTSVELRSGGRTVAVLPVPRFSDDVSFDLSGHPCRIARDPADAAWVMWVDGAPVAQAVPSGVVGPNHDLEIVGGSEAAGENLGRRLSLVRDGLFLAPFALRDGARPVARFQRRFGPRAGGWVDADESLPEAAVVFALWLVLHAWRRQRRAAA